MKGHWADGLSLEDLDVFALWLAADWERKAAAFAALSPDTLPGKAGKGPGAAFDWLRS